jgi:hypothetical protein
LFFDNPSLLLLIYHILRPGLLLAVDLKYWPLKSKVTPDTSGLKRGPGGCVAETKKASVES